MRIALLLLVACLQTLVVSLQAEAAIYFVDFASGSDAANGLATSTAWKHCPGDVNATGVPAVTSLAAGDTVRFKGGVSYLGGVVIGQSGSSGNRITYDGTGDTWGTGRAVLTAAHGLSPLVGFSSTDKSNLTIQGFDITAYGYRAVFGDGVLITRGSNLTVTNCYFHDIGFSSNAVGVVEGDLSGCGVYAENTSNLKIANCEMTRMHTGIALRATSGGMLTITNTEITSCNIHDYLVWLIDVATSAPGTTVSGLDIANCSFHDFYQFNSACWLGDGEKPHTDGVFLRADGAGGTSTWTNINIHANTYYQGATSCNGGTSMNFIVGGVSVNIFNNIFTHVLQSDSIEVDSQLTAGGIQVINIFENTFVDISRGIYVAEWLPGNQRQASIKNNIFYWPATGSQMIAVQNKTNLTALDYNSYFATDATQDIVFVGSGGGFMKFPAMQTAGWEAHGRYGNPSFVDISHDYATAPLLNNLRLRAGSGCVGTGATLPALYATDKDGTLRPQGTGWDMGAYELITATGGGKASLLLLFYPDGRVTKTNVAVTMQPMFAGTMATMIMSDPLTNLVNLLLP